MCIEAIQRYNGCSCKTIHNLICTKHVDETRKQLNTAPCPDLELRLLETQEGGCGRRVQSRPCKTDTSWTFENWTDHRHRPGSRKFCEERMTGKHTCDDGRWLLGRDHTCGVGSGEMRWWRHRFILKQVGLNFAVGLWLLINFLNSLTQPRGQRKC